MLECSMKIAAWPLRNSDTNHLDLKNCGLNDPSFYIVGSTTLGKPIYQGIQWPHLGICGWTSSMVGVNHFGSELVLQTSSMFNPNRTALHHYFHLLSIHFRHCCRVVVSKAMVLLLLQVVGVLQQGQIVWPYGRRLGVPTSGGIEEKTMTLRSSHDISFNRPWGITNH